MSEYDEVATKAIDGLSNYIRQIDGNHEMGAGELAERVIRGWLPPSRLIRWYSEKAWGEGAHKQAQYVGGYDVDDLNPYRSQ